LLQAESIVGPVGGRPGVASGRWALQVADRLRQSLDIVSEKAEPAVARGTEQGAHGPGAMVVIDVQPFAWLPTAGAPAALLDP
jgi:hypothetical protein